MQAALCSLGCAAIEGSLSHALVWVVGRLTIGLSKAVLRCLASSICQWPFLRRLLSSAGELCRQLWVGSPPSCSFRSVLSGLDLCFCSYLLINSSELEPIIQGILNQPSLLSRNSLMSEAIRLVLVWNVVQHRLQVIARRCGLRILVGALAPFLFSVLPVWVCVRVQIWP